jgi:uncharacterized membrane protein YfcA
MAIAALMSNIARVAAWWREVNWRAFAAYSLPGMPAAAVGARTLLILPSRVVDITLGVFFLAMIPLRRWHRSQPFQIRLWQLAIAGACIGFLTGVGCLYGRPQKDARPVRGTGGRIARIGSHRAKQKG